MSPAPKRRGHNGNDGEPPRVSRGASQAFDALKRRAERAEQRLAEAQECERAAELRAAAAEASAVEGLFEVRAALERIEKDLAKALRFNLKPPITEQPQVAPISEAQKATGSGLLKGWKEIGAYLGFSAEGARVMSKRQELPVLKIGKTVAAKTSDLGRGDNLTI